MVSFDLHRLVLKGDLTKLREYFDVQRTSEEINGADQMGYTPLMYAVEKNSVEAVKVLLKAGAEFKKDRSGSTALEDCENREIVQLFLAAGLNEGCLNYKNQRLLLGLEPEANSVWFDATEKDFLQSWMRRFGKSNPEYFQDPYYLAMIRSGICGFLAASSFPQLEDEMHPIWSARRYGQSMTFLPDGRITQIGGEHEDFYDPDFCIYNDVFVHHPGGAVDVLGYPKEIFPPTDFHTATLLDGRFIWIIGSLGYFGARCYGETPVYRLDTISMQMEKMETTGLKPGWIFKHTASANSENEIMVTSGKIVSLIDDKEVHLDNLNTYLLNIDKREWQRE